MKRSFLALAVLAVSALGFVTTDASAWGWWRYRAACCGHTPFFARWRLHHGNHAYNAFTPVASNSCGCNSCFTRHARHAGGCSTCMAAPVMGDMQNAQYVDPSLMPYMAQAAMPMPVQPVAYQAPYGAQYGAPYGMQPVSYAPAYYPAYQPYPAYYYPMPQAYPTYGYGYGYGYGY